MKTIYCLLVVLACADAVPNIRCNGNVCSSDDGNSGQSGLQVISGSNSAVLGPGVYTSDGGAGGLVQIGSPSASRNGGMFSSSGSNGGTFVSSGNSGGNVISGGSGASITSNCQNNVCRTCINNRCYNRQFGSVMNYNSCGVAVCENLCMGMVFPEGQECPVCRCNGFSTGEPCLTQTDCKEGGTCQNEICRYAPITGNYDPTCTFSYQCTSEKTCDHGRCVPTPDGRRHAGIGCVFPSQCPAGFGVCQKMTCWDRRSDGGVNAGGGGDMGSMADRMTGKFGKMMNKFDAAMGANGGGAGTGNGQEHIPGISCVFDYQCPTKYK